MRAALRASEILAAVLRREVPDAACGGSGDRGAEVAGAHRGLERGGVDVKRRSFLGGLVGLFAAPAVVASKNPVPAVVDWRSALPVVGPPPMTAAEISARMQEYIRSALPVFESVDSYREEFIAGFEAKQTLLREIVGRK